VSASDFPELPGHIVSELQHRACRIPQVKRNERSNVIEGEFLRAGQTDWAVLCTTEDGTRLLVFSEGPDQQPMEIERHISSARWSIRALDQPDLTDWVSAWGRKPFPSLTHQGISSFIESGDLNSKGFYNYSAEQVVFYFDRGKWVKLGTVDVN
jgi:hypothetical protein